MNTPMIYTRVFLTFCMWSLFMAGALVYEFPGFYRSLYEDCAFYAGLFFAMLYLVNGVLGYLIKEAYWIEDEWIHSASGTGFMLAFLFLVTLASFFS